MKKFIVTAAFTFFGVIAVSAQTETQKPVENPGSQPTTTQTQPQTQNPQTTSGLGTPNQGTVPATDSSVNTNLQTTEASPNADTTLEGTKPNKATKEERKFKKKVK